MKKLNTAYGEIEYTLSLKKIKNINLRIKPNGEVRVSAPLGMPLTNVEDFISEKSAWITKSRKRISENKKTEPELHLSNDEIMHIFAKINSQVFPLFADLLQGCPPEIIVKPLKSRWGVCYPRKKRIVFSSYLALKPIEAIEYVVLHEYVHFLHPNHQAGFHAEMQRLMPDYKQRRTLLR